MSIDDSKMRLCQKRKQFVTGKMKLKKGVA